MHDLTDVMLCIIIGENRISGSNADLEFYRNIYSNVVNQDHICVCFPGHFYVYIISTQQYICLIT